MGIETSVVNFNGQLMTYDQFRSSIIARNSYGENNPYQSTNKIGKIGNYLNVIPQLGGIANFGNTLLSRGFSAVGIGKELTNLEKIGTQMLIKQFSYTSAAHLGSQFIPKMDLSKVLSWKNPFSFPVDFEITKDASAGWIKKIVDKSFYNTSYITNANPLPKTLTNVDIIENTGKGQLTQFLKNINLNIYKPISEGNDDDTTSQSLKLINGNKNYGGVTLTTQSQVINDKKFFNFNYSIAHPYLVNASLYATTTSIDLANAAMRKSYSLNKTDYYAPNIGYVTNNFGKTNITPIKNNIYTFVSSVDDDLVSNKLVWGRDGITDEVKDNLNNFHGDTLHEKTNLEYESKLSEDFKINGGLLEYTRNLLNSTNGHFVDITRKVFTNGEEIMGYNGSPLWQANNSIYAQKSENTNKTGIRQHSILDQYDRNAKTIRFLGNEIYNGNPNSVIYKSVIPKIHPTDGDNGNKNMMFSIENLAINVIKDPNSGFGIIDDEYGSQIPASEIGPFMGRIMWFPPYDISVNETASAKFESTVMVGRNEPMYNYQNSERTATLSFVLLVDYPEQLKNFKKDENYKKNVADFFAFGGNPLLKETDVQNLNLRIKTLENEINKISNGEKNVESPTVDVQFDVFFQNDYPSEKQIDSVMNLMYNSPNNYEISSSPLVESGKEQNGDGLNNRIYFISGLTKTNENKYIKNNISIDQYNVGEITNQNEFGICDFNKILKERFANVEDRKLYQIEITGFASRLYEIKDKEKDYNYNLGLRRAKAVKKFVESRLKAVLDINDLNEFKFKSLISEGSQNGNPSGAKVENINKLEIKKDRRVTIKISRNADSAKTNKNKLNVDELKTVEEKKTEIDNIKSRLDKSLTTNYNVKTINSKGTLNTFENVKENYYEPANHSQTPEDFHKRLTFLQQCVRQGAAKRYDTVVNDAGSFSTKNSAFGKQPICILRIGDFFYTKIVIENVTIDYSDTTWDMNPEGFGMQPMLAKVSLQMKIIGGQSLLGPIDALQNAVTFNYYANSTFTDSGMYSRPSEVATNQNQYMFGASGSGGIIGEKQGKLGNAYKTLQAKNKENK